MRAKAAFGLVMSMIVYALPGYAETDTVLILHTNDIHGHIRPGYNALGGLPYVSGYIDEVRAHRADTLVLDAGDIINKGDLVAHETGGGIMYEAMARMKYDAIAPGNHDLAEGALHLLEFVEANALPVLCVNVITADRLPVFAPSRLVDVDGVQVGVLGMTVPGRSDECLDTEQTIRAVAEEAERLDERAHLVVAVCHFGSSECAKMSLRATHVDVFISGHAHELIEEPKVVEGTGALIICAGDYAKHVGTLELTIDLDTEAIVETHRELVAMRHDAVPCDTRLAKWVKRRERKYCRKAGRVVARCDGAMDKAQTARMCAEAMRLAAGADIGAFEPRRVVSPVPVGAVDVNALFMTSREGKDPVVKVALTGAEILAYVEGSQDGRNRPQWTGFEARLDYEKSYGSRVLSSNLESQRTYTIAVTETEWLSALKGVLSEARAAEAPILMTEGNVLDALTAYAKDLGKRDMAIDTASKELQRTYAP